MFGYAYRAAAAALTFIYTLVMLTTCAAQPNSPIGAATLVEDVALGQSTQATVHILQSRGEISPELQRAVELYQQERGLEGAFTIRTVSGEAEYKAALRAGLAGGQQVDLFHLFGYRDAVSLKGYLEDLSGLEWLEQAMEGTLDAVTFDEGIYGIPYSLEAIGLIANVDIFADAGVSLTGVVTYDDLRNAFSDLREVILSGELDEDYPGLETVTEFPGGDRDFMGQQLANIVLTDSFASPVDAALSPTLGYSYSEGAESYVELLASYTSSRVYWENLLSVAVNWQVENGLATQRVAVIQQNVDVYRQVSKINPDLRLSLLPIPLEDSETSSIYTGVPVYWGVNAQSSDASKELAMDFLTWLYRSEVGSILVAEGFGAVSVFRDTAADTGVGLHRQMLQYVEQGRARPMVHSEFPNGWGSDVFAAGLADYLSDGTDWEAMLEEAALEWTKLRQAGQ